MKHNGSDYIKTYLNKYFDKGVNGVFSLSTGGKSNRKILKFYSFLTKLKP